MVQEPLIIPITLNQTWSMDFMCDSIENGRRFRFLTLIDDYNREALAVEPQHIFPGEHVVNVLDDLIFYRGKPDSIRVDNGPEFISKAFVNWCIAQNIKIKYIQQASLYKMHLLKDSTDYSGKMYLMHIFSRTFNRLNN